MLVSAKEMLEKAKAGHYAVGQFNINNLEWTKAILLTAQEKGMKRTDLPDIWNLSGKGRGTDTLC